MSSDAGLVAVSKFLSKHLRHTPGALGLALREGGWVAVEELLAASARAGFPIAPEVLRRCVQDNDKQRFAFDASGAFIRANQGHSVEVELGLAAVSPPPVLYHGTVERFVAAILAEGLRRGRRHHVHLSREPETARRVGARRGVPVLFEVAAGRMQADGHAFFVSANGVWLADAVPPAYLRRLPS